MKSSKKSAPVAPLKIGVRLKTTIALLLMVFFCGRTALAAQRVTAVGRVLDADGKPIEHAAVLVYSAGVRKGLSIFCPPCYVDCGKRTFTDSDGKYTIPGLNSDLFFQSPGRSGGLQPRVCKQS